MNWINSSAVRAGFGPPAWIVGAIIFGFLVVALLENVGAVSEYDDRGAVLSQKEKRGLTVVGVVVLPLIGFGLWQMLAG